MKLIRCLARVRLPGDSCLLRSKERARTLDLLKPLRDEIKMGFKDLTGVDFGITVGLALSQSGLGRFDIVAMT